MAEMEKPFLQIVQVLNQVQQNLWDSGFPRSAGTELALLLLGWAKLSESEKIAAHLRLTADLAKDPKLVAAAMAELGQSSDPSLQVFSEAPRVFKGEAGSLIAALETVLLVMKAGIVEKIGAAILLDLMTGLGSGDFRLDSMLAEFLADIAGIAQGDSVYLPWDAIGQLAARAANLSGRAYLETTHHSLIPGSAALLCERPFEVHFSDPVRTPSAVEGGKPIRFDRSVCFPPFGIRYEPTVAQKDWFGRFPEQTGAGSVLAIRHLLWQTKTRAVIAVPNNLLFSTGVEQDLREDLLRLGAIEAVIAMRSGLLTETNIPFSVLILDPRGGHDHIRFVRGDADRFVESESKARFRLKGYRELTHVIRSPEDTPDARTITVKDIAPGAQLQPSRYVLPKGTRRLMEVVSAAKTVALGELVRTIRPMNTKSGKAEPIEVHEIGAADLPAYGFIREPGRTVKMDSYVSAMNEDQFLRANDIVLIVKGSAGKVGIVPDEPPGPGPGGWIAGQSAIVLRVKDQANVDPKALALQLRSEIGQSLLKNIVSGATIPLIQLRELMTMPILLPSTEEQRRAAQVLANEDHVQKQIDDLRQRQARLASGLWTLGPEDQDGSAGRPEGAPVDGPGQSANAPNKPARHIRRGEQQ